MALNGVRRAVRRLAKVPSDAIALELERRRSVASELESKRATLLAEVADLEREIRECGGSLTGAEPRRDPARASGRRPKNKATLAATLAKILRGKTMTVVDAADAVRKAGYKTNSRTFRTQVNIALIKGPFRRTGRGEYTAT